MADFNISGSAPSLNIDRWYIESYQQCFFSYDGYYASYAHTVTELSEEYLNGIRYGYLLQGVLVPSVEAYTKYTINQIIPDDDMVLIDSGILPISFLKNAFRIVDGVGVPQFLLLYYDFDAMCFKYGWINMENWPWYECMPTVTFIQYMNDFFVEEIKVGDVIGNQKATFSFYDFQELKLPFAFQSGGESTKVLRFLGTRSLSGATMTISSSTADCELKYKCIRTYSSDGLNALTTQYILDGNEQPAWLEVNGAGEIDLYYYYNDSSEN